MLVAGRDFSEEMLARIRLRVEGDSTLTRTALSREVCRWLGWQGADGQPKDMSCRMALLKLARRGHIDLPAAREVSFAKPAAVVGAAQISWPAIEAPLAELGRIWLVAVDSGQSELSSTWWAMMQTHHPLGAGPLCGAQLRYLVVCEAGIVGGLSFSAPAWRLAPRDAWIGWDDPARQAGLSKVVANSRFLILPSVRVPNLASHVLSQALARLANDWQSRYGITPVLVETFVDRTHYRGTCYRAANWILLGQTQGRGRQDRRHLAQGTIKDIWAYPLQSHWQAILRANAGAPVSHRPVKLSAAPIIPLDWAQEEFGDCALPDARLQRRLLSLARDFYARPTANVAQACASRAKTKAAYRFLDHEQTTMDTLLQPHYRATEARVRAASIVLAVQDSTSLNYTAHAATEGLGPIGSNLNGPQGLHLHSTLAFNTQGTPLGFLDAQCWSRDPDDFGKKARRHHVPIEEIAENQTAGGEIVISQAILDRMPPDHGFTLEKRSDLTTEIGTIYRVLDGRRLSGVRPSRERYPIPYSEAFYGDLVAYATRMNDQDFARRLEEKYLRYKIVVLIDRENEESQGQEISMFNHLSFSALMKDIGLQLLPAGAAAEIKVVGTLGIYVFDDAPAALDFARSFRQAFAKYDIACRIGIDAGAVVLFDLPAGGKDSAGNPVNVASKMAQDNGIFGKVYLGAAMKALVDVSGFTEISYTVSGVEMNVYEG